MVHRHKILQEHHALLRAKDAEIAAGVFIIEDLLGNGNASPLHANQYRTARAKAQTYLAAHPPSESK